jgi:hypothetical protein
MIVCVIGGCEDIYRLSSFYKGGSLFLVIMEDILYYYFIYSEDERSVRGNEDGISSDPVIRY